MAAIADADRLLEAQKVLSEADQIGVQVTTIATQMAQVATQYAKLMSFAADQDDGDVFAGRMVKSIASAKQQLSSLGDAERKLLSDFLNQVFA